MDEVKVGSGDKKIDVIESWWKTLILCWDPASELLDTYVLGAGKGGSNKK